MLLRGSAGEPWDKRVARELGDNEICSMDLRQWYSPQKSSLEMVVTWLAVLQRFEWGSHF